MATLNKFNKEVLEFFQDYQNFFSKYSCKYKKWGIGREDDEEEFEAIYETLPSDSVKIEHIRLDLRKADLYIRSITEFNYSSQKGEFLKEFFAKKNTLGNLF